jgi:hypothetical protein
MIRIAAAILVLGSALAHPFNLDFAQLDAQMKQLEQLSGKLSPYNHLKLSPYTAAAKQPQFSAHFSPQSLQFSFGQHSPAQQQYSTGQQQQYSTAQQQQQQQYNPQDYLADPLGSFPVQYSTVQYSIFRSFPVQYSTVHYIFLNKQNKI